MTTPPRATPEPSEPSMPKAHTWLTWMIPASYRDDLLADLHEEYVYRHLPRLGARQAARRFNREVRRCALANLRTRLSHGWRSRPGPSPSPRRPGPSAGILESVAQDMRFAARSLLRSPSFTAVAVLTLGLGIGASTAIFSVMDGVMLKPLPFRDPGRLVVPWETFTPREILTGMVSFPNLEEWRTRSRAFDGLAGMRYQAYTLTGRELPERIEGARVTADFFPVLGIEAAQGRLFLPEDDAEGAANVAVVTRGFWVRHFGDVRLQGDETLLLDDRPHTIVGVLPGDFDFPFWVSGAEVWTPTALDYRSFSQREWPQLIPIARLRDGLRVAEAQSDMERVALEMEEAYPETNRDHGANVVPLMRVISSGVSGQLWLMVGAVALVLFVGCINVANLLLARGTDRRRELGVRSALGAGIGRVLRQLLAEGLLLSGLGGLLGMAFAGLGVGLLVRLLPSGYPRIADIGVDGRTLLFAVGISLVTCLLAATFPALQAVRQNIEGNLREGSRAVLAHRHQTLRRLLIVSEVALAAMVLAGSGLLVRSFQHMAAVDPGFDPQNLMTFRVATDWSRMQVYNRATFYGEAVRQIAALPGVTAAGAGSNLPITGRFMTTFQHEGQPELPRPERPRTDYVSVTPTYFEALGIPILRGDTFSEKDQRDSPGVILVNEAAAAAFWPGEEPVGKRIRPDVDITDVDPTVFEVVGLVGNVRDLGLDEEPSPTMYVPYTQQTWPTMTFAVRSGLERGSLVPQIMRIIDDLSREASFSFQGMDEVLSRSTEERRFLTAVMGIFGFLALVLAGVGVFGVLSYSVAQRTREMGLRRALGADGPSVFRLVTKESLSLLLVGGALGLVGSLAANRLLASFLFGVAATDAPTYFAAGGLLVACGLLASYLPARRATRVDPVVAMRAE